MPDAQQCLAMAEEADRLASIVSYGRDKTRLRAQAQSWREQAQAEVAASTQRLSNLEVQPHRMMVWLRRRKA